MYVAKPERKEQNSGTRSGISHARMWGPMQAMRHRLDATMRQESMLTPVFPLTSGMGSAIQKHCPPSLPKAHREPTDRILFGWRPLIGDRASAQLPIPLRAKKGVLWPFQTMASNLRGRARVLCEYVDMLRVVMLAWHIIKVRGFKAALPKDTAALVSAIAN